MNHGVEGFFQERALAARRVAALTAVLSVLVLGAVAALEMSPALRQRLLSPRYFGFEGPEQYQRRIALEDPHTPNGDVVGIGQVVPLSAQRGGHRAMVRSPHPNATPVPRARFLGPGESELDVFRRGSLRHRMLPEVRSEDLVFEQKVPAMYPQMLLERDVEGWVLLEVVVDTLGQVSDIEVRNSSGEPLFERSASEAARQCRFRPYRRDGRVSAIVTRLRFSFSIDRVQD